jgi:hypothetical protein
VFDLRECIGEGRQDLGLGAREDAEMDRIGSQVGDRLVAHRELRVIDPRLSQRLHRHGGSGDRDVAGLRCPTRLDAGGRQILLELPRCVGLGVGAAGGHP